MVALVHGQGTPYDSPVQYHIQTDEGKVIIYKSRREVSVPKVIFLQAAEFSG